MFFKALIDHVKQHEEDLRKTFLKCTTQFLTKEQAMPLLVELQRKFCHALSNEFITSRDEKEKEAKRERSKGANGLRDELYIISKKGKGKGRSI